MPPASTAGAPFLPRDTPVPQSAQSKQSDERDSPLSQDSAALSLRRCTNSPITPVKRLRWVSCTHFSICICTALLRSVSMLGSLLGQREGAEQVCECSWQRVSSVPRRHSSGGRQSEPPCLASYSSSRTEHQRAHHRCGCQAACARHQGSPWAVPNGSDI